MLTVYFNKTEFVFNLMITGLIKIHFKFLIITPPRLFKQQTNYTASKKRTFTLSKNNHWVKRECKHSKKKAPVIISDAVCNVKNTFLFLNSPECRIQSVSASYDQHSSVPADSWDDSFERLWLAKINRIVWLVIMRNAVKTLEKKCTMRRSKFNAAIDLTFHLIFTLFTTHAPQIFKS